MEESAKKICEAALGTPKGYSVILLAHNGPSGLGSKINDICGRDWVMGGGDHGDLDLAQALSDMKKSSQIPIPLVVFGHMHKELAYGNGLRKMIVVGDDGAIYLNGAIVPRVKSSVHELGTNSVGIVGDETIKADMCNRASLRAFTVIEMLGGKVEKIAESWVPVSAHETSLKEEHILFKNVNDGNSSSESNPCSHI